MAERTGFFGAVGRIFARVTAPRKIDGVTLVPIGNTIAGVRLWDPQEALKLAAVYRCVDLISSTVAILPWNVLMRDADGQGRPAPDHPVTWILKHEANAEMTAFDFQKALVANLLLEGNGYAEIERNNRGAPIALWLLDPQRVMPARTNAGRLVYEVTQRLGDKVIVPAEDMFHVHGLAWDGLVGYSVLDVARRSIATAMAQDESTARFFGQGMRPVGFLKTKGKISADGLASLLRTIEDNFTGVRNHGRPIPLDQDMTWEKMQADPQEAQLLDLKKFSVVEMCRWFGVPPHMAMDLERATFTNIESQGQEFLNYGLMPRIVPMEQEADRKLLRSNRGGAYTKKNVNALVRGDMEKRGAYFQHMRNMGVFTVNDILRLEDMPTIGPEGDVRVMQVQYQPIGKDGAPEAPASAPPAATTQPAEPAPEEPKPAAKRAARPRKRREA